jgi:hypothetical protein
MVYTIEKGIINTKTWFKRLAIGLTALAMPVGLVASVGGASAAPPPFQLQPFEFVGTADQCGGTAGTDTVTAKWDNSTGAPAPSIFLQKQGATTNCAAAGVDIITPLEGQAVSNLTELNFEYKDGGHCGAGAPRFNIELDGSNTAFLGCNSTLGTRSPATTSGWTHVEFSEADIASAVTLAGGTPTSTLTDLSIIFDEGSDTPTGGTIGTAGEVNIDNISVNTEVVGSPTSPITKQDCKNGGWMNLTDAQGNPFENQGQCVAYVNGGGTHVHNLTKVNNNNNVGVLNFNGQNANSGRAVVKNNTTGGNATSGNAGNSNASNFNIVVSNF